MVVWAALSLRDQSPRNLERLNGESGDSGGPICLVVAGLAYWPRTKVCLSGASCMAEEAAYIYGLATQLRLAHSWWLHAMHLNIVRQLGILSIQHLTYRLLQAAPGWELDGAPASCMSVCTPLTLRS